MNAVAKILKEKSEPVHVNVSFEEPLYGQRAMHEPITVEIPQIQSDTFGVGFFRAIYECCHSLWTVKSS